MTRREALKAFLAGGTVFSGLEHLLDFLKPRKTMVVVPEVPWNSHERHLLIKAQAEELLMFAVFNDPEFRLALQVHIPEYIRILEEIPVTNQFGYQPGFDLLSPL